MGSGAAARTVSSASAPETKVNAGGAGGLVGGGSEVEPHAPASEVARIGASRSDSMRTKTTTGVHRQPCRGVRRNIPETKHSTFRTQARGLPLFAAGNRPPVRVSWRRSRHGLE